ncbi:MAG: NAD-glutamate dehydrogenase [Oligoflexia bacterium]|nr:NAD-glutamate dehydrogenase [Oligoflexia bacterium]
MNREQFFTELKSLQAKFDALAPELELTVRDPEMGVEGYVVVWTTLAAKGGPLGRCGKGGTRITTQVSLDEVKMLARIMALKNAAAGLPLGGAKSGLRADPAAPGFEQKYRRFVSLVKPTLVENGGIFGGFGFDIGGAPIHAVWACDEMKSTRGFTGKPVEMGGTDYDREGIAGLGVSVAAETMLKFLRCSPKQTSCAIQGLGAMGAAVFRYFGETGANIRFISDPRLGGTFELTSAPTADLRKAVIEQNFERTKALLTEIKAHQLGLDEVLYQDVSLLFPCAVQGVISAANQARIKAKYIVEGANNPCSEETRSELAKRGVTIIPDFIANPGGIIAAFVEMNSKISPAENAKTRKNVEDAKQLTRDRISENVSRIMQLVSELSIEPQQAGKYLALKNIFKS